MMGSYGERWIENKIEDNKIIRISEFKVFSYDYSELIENIQDRITDDYEALAEHKIYYDLDDNIDNFDVDALLEWLDELLYEAKESELMLEEDYDWFAEWRIRLEEAKGFVIHLNWTPEWILSLNDKED